MNRRRFDIKRCDCDFATSGSCFLRHDEVILALNRKLIERPSRLGWYAFAQEEAVRLHEKSDWMEKLGIDDICEIECEYRKVEK